MANASSTPGFLQRLGFKLVCPLPVVAGVVFPMGRGDATSRRVTPQFLRSQEFGDICASIEAGQATTGVFQNWTGDKLRWRLSSPRAKYAVHTHRTGTLVTTAAPLAAGIPAALALKFLPHSPSDPVDSKALLRKAAGFHRSPFFVYSGFQCSGVTARASPAAPPAALAAESDLSPLERVDARPGRDQFQHLRISRLRRILTQCRQCSLHPTSSQ